MEQVGESIIDNDHDLNLTPPVKRLVDSEMKAMFWKALIWTERFSSNVLRKPKENDERVDCRASIIQSIEQILLSQFIELIKPDGNPEFLSPNRSEWSHVYYDPNVGLIPSPSVEISQFSKTSFRSKGSRAKYTRILFVLQKVLHLLMQGTFATQRDVYYEAVKELKGQADINDAIWTVSSMLRVPRYRLGIFASSKGLVFGDLRFLDPVHNDWVDCSISVRNVPEDIEDIIGLESSARFVVVVEKDATFQKLAKSEFFSVIDGSAILITGKGVPDINTRHMLRKIQSTLGIPVFAIVDGDPYGIDIMFTYKYGSLSMAWCCEDISVPSLKWIGVHPTDFVHLSPHHRMNLTETDFGKCGSLLERPYTDEFMAQQIRFMMKIRKKVEIESLENSLVFYFMDKVIKRQYI